MTGVQTCALPISEDHTEARAEGLPGAPGWGFDAVCLTHPCRPWRPQTAVPWQQRAWPGDRAELPSPLACGSGGARTVRHPLSAPWAGEQPALRRRRLARAQSRPTAAQGTEPPFFSPVTAGTSRDLCMQAELLGWGARTVLGSIEPGVGCGPPVGPGAGRRAGCSSASRRAAWKGGPALSTVTPTRLPSQDRKSTRLNSSH